LSSENRKQLNFNGNLPVRSPPTPTFLSENQFYQLQQQQQQQLLYSPDAYRPAASTHINPQNAIRKRPKFPYQFANPYSSSPQSPPSDLSNPIYQNYANYYQYPSPSSSQSSPYYDYYTNPPTRYTSQPTTSANLYGHPLHQSPQPQYSNYYTNNYANQFGYQRPTSPLYANNNAPSVSNFISNVRDSGPLNQLSTVGSQFSKALEDISINDDLQCVPKLLCTMIRNPRQPNQLPSFLNIPGLTA
jgi:hypothetical protein